MLRIAVVLPCQVVLAGRRWGGGGVGGVMNRLKAFTDTDRGYETLALSTNCYELVSIPELFIKNKPQLWDCLLNCGQGADMSALFVPG